MTRKDYELLTDCLKTSLKAEKVLAGNSDKGIRAVEATIIHLSLVLELNNPRFDPDKFMAECGVKFNKSKGLTL